jgi:hypothetical protein
MSVKWKTMKVVFRYCESTSGPITGDIRPADRQKSLTSLTNRHYCELTFDRRCHKQSGAHLRYS